MALLKRLSYFRLYPQNIEEDYQLYLLCNRPLRPSETIEDRNQKIKKIINNYPDNDYGNFRDIAQLARAPG